MYVLGVDYFKDKKNVYSINTPRPHVHHFDTSSEDDEDEYAYWVNAVKSRKKAEVGPQVSHALRQTGTYLPTNI